MILTLKLLMTEDAEYLNLRQILVYAIILTTPRSVVSTVVYSH